MIDALQAIRYSLQDFWDEFVMLVVLNVLWSLIAALPAAPLITLSNTNLVAALILAIFLALPLPIVTGGLCFFTNQVARGKSTGWETFFAGVRRYWTKSLAVAAVNLVALVLFLTNIQFYNTILPDAWRGVALILWIALGIYWLIVQIFWFPMILELENEKVLLALRNALAMVFITPTFSLTLALIMAVLAILCIALTIPVVLIMVSLLLLISNHATRSRLAFVQKKPYKPGLSEELTGES